jgi:oligo-1,6-glucosidase
VQWDDTENAGFTTGEPWFYVNENYKDINVAQQEQDPDSILNFYKKAIRLRKELPVVRYGDYKEHFPLSASVYTYTRSMDDQKLLVVCSFTKEPVHMFVPKEFDLEEAELILHNYEDAAGDTLKPYECRVYLLED